MTLTLPHPTYDLGLMPSARRLRAALRANAAFSLASGGALLVGGPFIPERWGLGPSWLPPLVGVMVLCFAAIVARVSVLPSAAVRTPSRVVIAADVAWVVASIAILAVAGLPTSGTALIAVVAAVVAALAIGQLIALSALRDDDHLGEVEVVEVRRTLPGDPERVWALITDHDLYGRLAPNLTKVETISQPGEPLRRRCTTAGGHAWEETCTLWDENHRFAVEVDTRGYPYPLESMRGLWQVDPDPTGSRIAMRFVYQTEPTVRGGLFSLVFRPMFPTVLSRIVRGWRAELSA